jgi:hypothetical protein
MTDIASTVDNYIAIWNETDPQRRRELIGRTWTDDATYVDPHMSSAGHGEIEAMVAGVQERFPGHRFELSNEADAHHDVVRFGWKLSGPNGQGPIAFGQDFGTLAEDGRLRAITGFLEPAAA